MADHDRGGAEGERLADHTTLRVGGPARRWVHAQTEDELIEAVAAADAAGEPVLLLGGGSNLVIDDAGFDGVVVLIETRGVRVTDTSACGGAEVHVAAGEVWDDLVARAVSEGWAGVEALSGIPGLVGATPIQNVGAYGAEVAQVVARVRTWDRREGRISTMAAADCAFSYRNSAFKSDPQRWVVLEVVFTFEQADLSAPIRYAELAQALSVEIGERTLATQVREAVLSLRAGKGMVLDAADHDTWSAGSFFTNPLLDADEVERLPADAPRFPAGDQVKSSAAWLIEHAGFTKGYGQGSARLSTKHTLALTNTGNATSADVLALAREVRDGVRDRFGITLVNEPVMINCEL
ncbi:MAG: UDP-N-acetylmuramate dehydrogenase [Propionibacteriales bacterium]|nr:UDP-N-acetylmuramate dehydrogenase [Propionibacteriales bacterium]